MPDMGPHVECNTCGRSSPWQSVNNGVKRLPKGWTKVEGTLAGTVYFCSPDEEGLWKSTREWQIPDAFISTVVSDDEVEELCLPCPVAGCEHVSTTWEIHYGHMGAVHSDRRGRRKVQEIADAAQGVVNAR